MTHMEGGHPADGHGDDMDGSRGPVGEAEPRHEGDTSQTATAAADTIAGRTARTFLAQELGGTVGEDGELKGVSIKDVFLDPQLRAMALRLWRQMQSEDKRKHGDGEGKDSFTVEELFGPGLTETVSSSSTRDELVRYRKKLEFRADLLEALLEETLAELETASHLRPADAGGDAGDA